MLGNPTAPVYRGEIQVPALGMQVETFGADGRAVDGEPGYLTPPYTADGSAADPDISSGAEYKTIISYSDINQVMSDVPGV